MKYVLQHDCNLPQKRQQRSDSPYCSTNKSNFVAFIWTSSSALTELRNVSKSLVYDQLLYPKHQLDNLLGIFYKEFLLTCYSVLDT